MRRKKSKNENRVRSLDSEKRPHKPKSFNKTTVRKKAVLNRELVKELFSTKEIICKIQKELEAHKAEIADLKKCPKEGGLNENTGKMGQSNGDEKLEKLKLENGKILKKLKMKKELILKKDAEIKRLLAALEQRNTQINTLQTAYNNEVKEKNRLEEDGQRMKKELEKRREKTHPPTVRREVVKTMLIQPRKRRGKKRRKKRKVVIEENTPHDQSAAKRVSLFRRKPCKAT